MITSSGWESKNDLISFKPSSTSPAYRPWVKNIFFVSDFVANLKSKNLQHDLALLNMYCNLNLTKKNNNAPYSAK